MLKNPAQRPAWSRYVIAVLAVALAALVRAWLLGILGTRVPFLTFYPAVILAALYGGLAGGLIATALSALAVSFEWMEPVGRFYVQDPADWLSLGVFVMSCTAISMVTQGMRRAQKRASEAEAQVKVAMESRRAEEELRRYKLLAENSRDVILSMRRDDGQILEANEAAAKAYGYTRSELQSLSIHDLRAGSSEGLVTQLSDADTAGILFETVHRRKDGSTFPVEVSSQGATIGGTRTVISVIRDITERRCAEEALRASEEALRESETRYRRLVDLAPGALLVQQDDRIVYCNEAAARLYGVESPAGLMGTGMFDRVHPGDLPWVLERVRDAKRGARLPVREARHLRMDGSEVPVETTAGPVEWRGRPAMLVFVNDITDRKRSEARLRDAQKLESLGLLAGGVAHDFNNLLVGIIGNATLAQDLFPPDHPAAELLEGVLKSGEQAAHLTRQMLAYSGKGRFVVEPLELSALLSEIIGLVRPSVSGKIELRLNLERDLPAFEADRGQVQQVFTNLVLNAAEAMGGQEGLITVRTGVQEVEEGQTELQSADGALPAGRYVFLEVRDTGCGIDEAIQARMFDPFFSTKFVGRGLGLAAVAGIARGHNGAIRVTSAPGIGSCFRVLFPAKARGPAAADGEPSAHGSLRGSGTILVVDDEEAVRTVVKKALARYGYEVLVAESGTAAIQIVTQHPGELAAVILDLSMPGMSGEEVLPELRRIRPALKVLISSGYSEIETMQMFRGQQIAGFIQKPHTPRGLAEMLKVCLG